MKTYDRYEQMLKVSGSEVFWLGAASEIEIRRLESSLPARLPSSFHQFLKEYGGGGVVGAEISGIEDNDASLTNGGTVLGDTNLCRERYGLPSHLVVIYFHDDEVCWCLDTSRTGGDGECPIVSYNLFTKRIERDVAADFSTFMQRHLELYSSVK
jgi:hypothetical protein